MSVVLDGRILTGRYHDSVQLMRAADGLRRRPGVERAGIVMGTPANLELLREGGLAFEGHELASANDVVVGLAGHPDAVQAGLDAVPELLSPPIGDAAAEYPSLQAAAQTCSPTLALITVPGQHAAAQAHEALDAGCDVMVFSDNVSLEQELALKQDAARRGRMVMGPDCGTAIVDGVGLGFANAVPTGAVGILAASGTGAQTVACEISARGAGVSQLLGLGGRDLQDTIGGMSLFAGLERLAADAATDTVVVIAKSCGPQTFARLLALAGTYAKPTVLCLTAPGPWWTGRLAGLHVVPDLASAAETAVALSGQPHRPPAPATGPGGRPGSLRGCFTGGTLAAEALQITRALLGDVATNLDDVGLDSRHRIDDLGADEHTVGRPHPMIDPSPQAEQIEKALADPGVSAVLLDVVLGHAAHPDPASVLSPVIERGLRGAEVDGRAPEVHCSVVGLPGDPQHREHQVDQLRRAGAILGSGPAAAAFGAAMALVPLPAEASAPQQPRSPGPIAAIGAAWFADALADQGADVARVAWRPPVDLAPDLADLLRQLT